MTTESAAFDERQFLVLVALAGIGFGMTAPLTVLFAASFGASDTLAGLAVSSVAVSLISIDIFGTKLVPRVNGRFVMWFSLAVFGVGSIGSSLAVELWQMIAARVFQGIGAAFFMGGALQLVVRFAPPASAGRAIGIFNASWFGGVAAGPLFGGLLASYGVGQAGYRLAFVVCGGVCFAVALVARRQLPSIPPSQPPRLSLPRRPEPVGPLRTWPALALAVGGQITRAGLVFTILPLFGHRTLSLGTASVGIALSLLALVDLVAMRIGGALADRLGRRNVLLGGLISGCIVCVAAPAVKGPFEFVLWCAALGVVVGVMWVVPVAVVVDVVRVPEDGLSAYRIGADVGQLVGSTGAGAFVGLIGLVDTLLLFGAGFAALAVWVARLPEVTAARTFHHDAQTV